jgi:hypothetical protein
MRVSARSPRSGGPGRRRGRIYPWALACQILLFAAAAAMEWRALHAPPRRVVTDPELLARMPGAEPWEGDADAATSEGPPGRGLPSRRTP